MGREQRRVAYGTGSGGHSKERHRRYLRHNMTSGRLVGRAGSETNVRVLNPRPEVPSLNSKHQSYYELVENKDKKKKLELQPTSNPEPPPGYEFVPIGNPELTRACKEISREQDAMVFIVSTIERNESDSLSHQVNRIGHHVRQTIVEQAREAIGDSSDDSAIAQKLTGVPEPIPESQQEINEQADKAIRDLFPRIPNTDRQMIIEHSFKKGAQRRGGPLVGLAQDITLSRRVQLAVLAHIRHMHTRYDKLLRETTYHNARRAVESLCLDILVKWRGDEETGRDQLDEILREVIVISDEEGEEDSDDDDEHDNTDYEEEEDTSAEESGDAAERPASRGSTYSPPPATTPVLTRHAPAHEPYEPLHIHPAPAYISSHASAPRRHGGWRGFDRYQAALEARWGAAQVRVRRQEEQPSRVVSRATGPYDLASRQEPPPREQYQHPREAAQYHGSHLATGLQPDVQYDALQGYERTAPPPAAAENLHPGSGSRQLPRAYAYEEARAPGAPRYNRAPSETFRPYGSVDQPLHTQRRFVSSEQAPEYIVPSIESSAPTSRPRPLSQQYGHSAFSTGPAPSDTAHAHSNKRHSPTWSGDAHAATKRRRFIGNDAGMHHASPSQEAHFHHDPIRQEVVAPASRTYENAGDGTRSSVSRPYPYVAPPHHPQPVPSEPPSVHHGRFHLDAGPVPVPIGDRSRPIVVEDWERRASPQVTPFPVHNYREEPVAEGRHESVRPSVETRRSISRRPEKDHFARYRAVHESSLAGPNYETESGVYYHGTRNPPTNATESTPMRYRRPSPPPTSYLPHARHHNTEPEPVPQYVREARLHSHPYPTSGYQPPGYEPDVIRRRAGEPPTVYDHQGNLPPNGHAAEEPSYVQYRDRHSQQPPDNSGSRCSYSYHVPSYPPQH